MQLKPREVVKPKQSGSRMIQKELCLLCLSRSKEFTFDIWR